MTKIYECKLCGFKGTRKNTRKHIRENHEWKGNKSLTVLLKSKEIK